MVWVKGESVYMDAGCLKCLLKANLETKDLCGMAMWKCHAPYVTFLLNIGDSFLLGKPCDCIYIVEVLLLIWANPD